MTTLDHIALDAARIEDMIERETIPAGVAIMRLQQASLELRDIPAAPFETEEDADTFDYKTRLVIAGMMAQMSDLERAEYLAILGDEGIN